MSSASVLHQSEIKVSKSSPALISNDTITNVEFEKFLLTNIEAKQPIINQPKNQTTTTIPTKCRTNLWYLVFTGFALQFMIRIILNIAILDMILIKKSNTTNYSRINVTTTTTSYCFDDSKEQQTTTIISAADAEIDDEEIIINKRYSFERWLLDKFNIDYERNGFNWNEHQQSLLLGSFYWLTWITQIPGGILARRYGTKLVFGLSLFLSCFLNAFMPMASFISIRLALLVRVLQGIIVGFSIPSMHNLTAQWIPPNERSKFISAYVGGAVGVGTFFPIFGYIITHFSWEVAFHVCALIGFVWYMAWLYFVYDSPTKHPRIDIDERRYIEKSLAGTYQNNRKLPTPWKSILTSIPNWLTIMSHFGCMWGTITMLTQAPTYFRMALGWNISTIGLILGLPHFLKIIFSYIFGAYADYLLTNEKLSRTNVRKMGVFVCNTCTGLLLAGLAFSGCNTVVACVCLLLAITFTGATSTGSLSCFVDLSPNFSGITLGMGMMVGSFAGVISQQTVGWLAFGHQSIEQWKYVFLITSGVLITSGLMFAVFGSAKLQRWNNPNHSKRKLFNYNICKQ